MSFRHEPFIKHEWAMQQKSVHVCWWLLSWDVIALPIWIFGSCLQMKTRATNPTTITIIYQVWMSDATEIGIRMLMAIGVWCDRIANLNFRVVVWKWERGPTNLTTFKIIYQVWMSDATKIGIHILVVGGVGWDRMANLNFGNENERPTNGTTFWIWIGCWWTLYNWDSRSRIWVLTCSCTTSYTHRHKRRRWGSKVTHGGFVILKLNMTLSYSVATTTK